MRLEMVGERIDRGFDLLLERQRRRPAERLEPGAPKTVAAEEAMHVRALHATVGGRCALRLARDLQHRPRAVRALDAAEMDLITADLRAGGAMRAGHRRR